MISRLAFAAATVVLAAPALAEPTLLEACFPPAASRARADEVAPRKGPGLGRHPMPRLALPAAAPVAGTIVRRVELPPGRKLVALTLDLCEQHGEVAGYDGPVFDYLRAERIRATVFAGGKWMLSHPERAQQLIADPLLEIASHGFAHRNVRGLSGSELAAEIRGPEAAYQVQRQALAARQCSTAAPRHLAALKPHLSLYRFPFGACSREAVDTIAAAGMIAIQWDVSTGDAGPAESAQAIARTLVAEVRPGSIILAHANGRGHNTAAALPLAIPKLKARGFEFVTVSELMAAGKPVTASSCYDRRPGDTDRYDALFAPRRPRQEPADVRATTAVPR